MLNSIYFMSCCSVGSKVRYSRKQVQARSLEFLGTFPLSLFICSPTLMLFRHNFWTTVTGNLGCIIAAFTWFAEVPLCLLKMTSQTDSLMFWSDLVTSLAYYLIAIQLLRFANYSKVQ